MKSIKTLLCLVFLSASLSIKAGIVQTDYFYVNAQSSGVFDWNSPFANLNDLTVNPNGAGVLGFTDSGIYNNRFGSANEVYNNQLRSLGLDPSNIEFLGEDTRSGNAFFGIDNRTFYVNAQSSGVFNWNSPFADLNDLTVSPNGAGVLGFTDLGIYNSRFGNTNETYNNNLRSRGLNPSDIEFLGQDNRNGNSFFSIGNQTFYVNAQSSGIWDWNSSFSNLNDLSVHPFGAGVLGFTDSGIYNSRFGTSNEIYNNQLRSRGLDPSNVEYIGEDTRNGNSFFRITTTTSVSEPESLALIMLSFVSMIVIRKRSSR